MKRFIGLFAVTAGLVLSLPPPVASAHSVTVDGLDGDWMTARTPANFNLGMIARDAVGHGEYVWRDVPDDGRTDINNPEFGADLLLVRVTGDQDGLAILVKTAATAPDPQVQIQVAIDLDRTGSSGQSWMAGLSDTLVVADAFWEYLVQTRFTSGSDDARVLDGSFGLVDTVSADAVTDTIELYVPWDTIGLQGPPSTPVRFSICSFRAESNDDVMDIGGSGISDALDCVTNYGDPRSSAPYPNTWDDLGDQSIDYFFDVFFDASGEVYAPLVVHSFAANNALAAGGEFIVVRNVSPASIALDAFKLGDEEAPDSGEGMLYFPAGATLGADGVYVVAQNGSDFVTAFGRQPDAELAGGTIAEDMTTAYSAWGNTQLALNNSGDHVMILDRSDTILDLVVYESGTYAGINPLQPTPGAGQVFARDSVGSDTDDCDADFQLVGFDECTGTGDCAECRACIGSSCVVVPDGTGCSDGDNCTVGETCQSGSCSGGAAKDCSAQDDQCNDGVCNPSNGDCVKSAANENGSCDDGNACTTNDRCNSGACAGNSTVDCDDNDPCTLDLCATETGICYHSDIDDCCLDHDDCDDGDPCTEDLCSGAGGTCSNDPIAGCPGSDAGAVDGGGTGDAGVADASGEGPGGSDASTAGGGDGGASGSAGRGGSGETAGSDGRGSGDDAGTPPDGEAGDSDSGCGCAVVGSDDAGSRRPGLACLLVLFCAALLGRRRGGRSPRARDSKTAGPERARPGSGPRAVARQRGRGSMRRAGDDLGCHPWGVIGRAFFQKSITNRSIFRLEDR